MVHRIVCMYRYRHAVTVYITVGFAVNLLAGVVLVANTMDVVNGKSSHRTRQGYFADPL